MVKHNKTYTAEAVTAWHPDKICDQISDAILDRCLKEDPLSRVAVECIGGHNMIVLIGEITTHAVVDYARVAHSVYRDLTGKDIGVLINIDKQSYDIAKGVDKGGAGDQGIMIGYASSENVAKIPDETYLARELLRGFEVDGKSQVTMKGDKATQIVLSIQGKTQEELMAHVQKAMIPFLTDKTDVYCNNTGSFEIGGFDSDTGCTGRKIVVDAYGPRVPVGGGSFSGKDPSKVDRSGAYMARFIALEALNYFKAKEALVKLGYVIGKAEPIMKRITVTMDDGKTYNDWPKGIYDCNVQAIIERFDLRRPIYLDTAKSGHFGRPELPWEKIQYDEI
jgi:S-adenosylmethionine synthetase